MTSIAAERHGLWFALLVTLTVALDWRYPGFWEGWGLALLLIMVVVTGVPHGAMDLYLGLHTLKLRQSSRMLGFLLGYGGLALALILAWWWWSGAMLGLFLALSVVHFGDSDSLGGEGPLGWPEHLARGLCPVVLPLGLHPEASAALLAVLAPPAVASALVSLAGSLWIPTLLVCLVAVLARLWSDERAALWLSLELGALSILFGVLPPLAAFALYFGLLHSTRHLLKVNGISRSGRPLRQTLLITGVTLLAGCFGYLLLREQDPGAALLRVVFIGLAALTVPHMLLIHLARRRRVLV